MHSLSCQGLQFLRMHKGSFMIPGYYEFFIVKKDKCVSKYNFILLILYTQQNDSYILENKI